MEVTETVTKIGVSGNRRKYFTDYIKGRELVFEILDSLVSKYENVIFGNGASPQGGVDQIVIEYCKLNGIPIKLFPPYWNLPSPERYHKRNRELVEWSDLVVCIFVERIRKGGTMYVYRYARRIGKPVRVYVIKTDTGVVQYVW